MKCLIVLFIVLAMGCVQTGQTEYEINNVTVKWLGHASFVVGNPDTIAYFDPFVLDAQPKKADYILITHAHFDHCSPEQVKKIQGEETRIIAPVDCVGKLTGKTNSIKPTEFFSYTSDNVRVSAYEAYNIGRPYHKKGEGVGLLLEINKTRIYHAGDTDNIPEFANLSKENIDVLLIPIGGKYTMNVTEAAEATKIIKPKKAIPMHYNSDAYGIADVRADAEQFKKLLAGSGIEVVILKPIATAE